MIWNMTGRGPVLLEVEIKWTRVNKPGHPMVREAVLCAGHARQLREMGLEVVKV